MDNHWQYIYYRIYNEDGALPVKNPVGSDSILGRIIAHSVTPPHNVRNIRHRIAVEEQLPYRYKPDVYLDRDRDGSPAQDVCRVSLSGDSYPGASPESAIGLIISGARYSDSRPLMCIEGEWTVEEHVTIGRGTKSKGTYTLYMVDSSTFTGHGSETDTWDTRPVSYRFSIIDGKITSDGQVTWLCISPDMGQWRIKAVLTRNNMQMEGVREAGSGSPGSIKANCPGIYRRTSRT